MVYLIKTFIYLFDIGSLSNNIVVSLWCKCMSSCCGSMCSFMPPFSTHVTKPTQMGTTFVSTINWARSKKLGRLVFTIARDNMRYWSFHMEH